MPVSRITPPSTTSKPEVEEQPSRRGFLDIIGALFVAFPLSGSRNDDQTASSEVQCARRILLPGEIQTLDRALARMLECTRESLRAVHARLPGISEYREGFAVGLRESMPTVRAIANKLDRSGLPEHDPLLSALKTIDRYGNDYLNLEGQRNAPPFAVFGTVAWRAMADELLDLGSKARSRLHA